MTEGDSRKMPSLFSSFPLPWLGGMVGPLSFLGAGIVLITYHLIKMYRESRQGKRYWYEQPLLWFGGASMVLGLVALADRMIVSLPDLWPGIVFFLGFVGISLLTLLCVLLMVALSANKQEPSKGSAHKAQRASSQRPSVRENPLLTTARMSLLVWACLCLMEIWFICGFLLPLMPNLPNLPLLGACLLALGLAAVGGIAWTFVQLPQLRQIERVRLEFAARTSPAYPALERVFPSQQIAPPLVPSILARYTPRAMVGWVVYGLAYGLAFGTIFTQNLTVLAFKLPMMLLATFLFGGLIFFFRLGLRLKVEATQDGLTSGSGFQTKQISWQEARLFATYQTPRLFGRKTMITYELSGSSKVVQWTRVMDTHSPLAIWRPLLPMDEYQRQMQELCELVTRKTGLPLHDLSEEKSMELRAGSAQERVITQFEARD